MLREKVHGMDDTLLLTQMRNGNRRAFDSLYEKYKRDVFNDAYKRLKDESLAEDIAPDVFVALWIKGSKTLIENLPGYLYIAVRNNVFRLMKRQLRFVPIPELLTVWTAPWQVDVSKAIKNGTNFIEIEVVNTWVNRLIEDSKLDEKDRLTHTEVNHFSMDSKYEQSGLIGPVNMLKVCY